MVMLATSAASPTSMPIDRIFLTSKLPESKSTTAQNEQACANKHSDQ